MAPLIKRMPKQLLPVTNKVLLLY